MAPEWRQRPYSIRTRIKTLLIILNKKLQVRQRPYSIRTRIKTLTENICQALAFVRDHIPLEQGLRQWLDHDYQCMAFCVRDHIPLEQGLRLWSAIQPPTPLGQRPYSIRTRIKTIITSLPVHQPAAVRDHIPLEQGLRQSSPLVSWRPVTVSETIFH